MLTCTAVPTPRLPVAFTVRPTCAFLCWATLQPTDLRPLEEERAEAARQAQLKGWRRLLAALNQNKALILGVVAVVAVGGYVLHQHAVFATVASQLQVAYAAAGRLWAMAANLVR